MERFLNDIADTWKNVICIGSGNEGTTAGHTAGRVSDEEEEVQELAVQEREPALNIQIWKSYVDEMDISISSPSGERVGPLREILGPQRFVLGDTELLVYYGEPKPYSVRQEIYISFIPRQSNLYILYTPAVYEGSKVIKPDLAAPGVLVNAPVPGGGYSAFSGTSFAAPFITGSAVLLMEWGVCRATIRICTGKK